MMRAMLLIGSLAGFSAVGLGAFGAHALRPHFAAQPQLQSSFETAVQYQFFHALALLLTAIASSQWPSTLFQWAGGAFTLGILLFCGSLYFLSLSGVTAWGALAPFGGVAFLMGWALLAAGAWRL